MRQSLSRPRQPRDVHAVGVGSASSHVVGARRRRGARSLPIAHTGEFSLRCGGVLTWRSLSCACDVVKDGHRMFLVPLKPIAPGVRITHYYKF